MTKEPNLKKVNGNDVHREWHTYISTNQSFIQLLLRAGIVCALFVFVFSAPIRMSDI